jgi:NitT/TauT family transport system substrate-binding protein
MGLVVVGCVVLSSTSCSFLDENDEAASGAPVARSGVRVPSDLDELDGDACGDEGVTDARDLAADRTIARCAPGSPAPEPLPAAARIRVGTEAAGEEAAPLLLALHFEEFAAENLVVEPVEYPDALALHQALGAGEVDAAVGHLDAPFFDQVADGTGVRLVLGGAVARAANDRSVDQPGLWIRSDQLTEPERYRDLEGTRFAVAGGIDDAVAAPLTAVVRQDDLSLNEVRIDLEGGDDAATLLHEGKVSGAWLDEPAWRSVAGDDRFELVATMPASESLGGVMVAGRLVDHERDRAVGLAFVRALVRTINTHLADDYQADDDVVAALAEALDVEPDDIRATPPWLFDWEVRSGTTERLQTVFVQLGSVLYEDEIPEREIVDRTLYRDAVGVSPDDDDQVQA